ncbi:hypothetical protein LX81_04231 [Palleronia aestuarii]|uniref:Uncharacterized protein n=1 Tax=Palleronia aestuarii TaxID=568105 RepID=A0A2W7MQX5_9RHOB|nr:hypothetical protein LX81_04231 [Palleronia aestuarii]
MTTTITACIRASTSSRRGNTSTGQRRTKLETDLTFERGQSANRSGGTFDHYLNEALIDSRSHVFATDLQRLVLGGEIGGLGESEMEIGAALIYNRALSDAETYLQTTYVNDEFAFV